MPPRSKVITMLPAYLRQEVERRLFENGSRDYEGLAQWVRGQGWIRRTARWLLPTAFVVTNSIVIAHFFA
jgi:hypothetical protein